MVKIKGLHICLYLLTLLFCAACEIADESTLISDVDVVLVDMSFTATIEDDSSTKTILDGKLGDGTRKVLWQPDDRIGLIAVTSESGEVPVYELENTIDEPSESVVFTGSSPMAPTYWALYPYKSDCHSDLSNGTLTFDLPAVQKYVKGSFDPDSTPMVAKSAVGQPLSFKNLCGLLALQLTGDAAVESIVFMGKDSNGNDMQVCGTHSVDMNYESVPEITGGGNSTEATDGIYVTLQCDEPVQLNTDEAVPFYIVLPPATYSTFMVIITTSEGDVMIREGKNPLTVKRSDIQPTANLGYAESVSVDLSERGTSNCYIVSEPGLYTFDATVIGNGEFGIIEDAGFHTSDPTISPVSVELLWEDTNGLIHNLAYDDGRISFMTMGIEGNALIAAKDAEGTILWSWHIWMTDQPSEQTYTTNSNTFTVLDRNIGAISSSGLDGNWENMVGTLYQWGRKDPFLQNLYTVASDAKYYNQSISNPTVYQTRWYNIDSHIWSPDKKTIYDPCPVGYRIPVASVFSGLTASQIESYDDHVFSLRHSDNILSVYPKTVFIDSGIYKTVDYSELLLSNSVQNYPYTFYIASTEIKTRTTYHDKSDALPIRCVKDVNHVDISLPQTSCVEFEDITTNSALLSANIISTGMSSVERVGFVYGITEDLDNSVTVVCDDVADVFSFNLTGLVNGTTYYVRPFAESNRGLAYGPLTSFMTLLADDVSHLSNKGTANSYIVSSAGKYSFNAVQGNTRESIGLPATAEVIWETRNTNEGVEVGDVIKEVSYLESGVVLFSTADTFVKGNALIAVKDANGTVLWSWHIWLTDQPEEHVYANNAGVMMDRNLGAISAEPGSVGALGLLYQWGRKDPFLNSASVYEYVAVSSTYSGWSKVNTSSSTGTIEYAIKHPTTIIYNSDISTSSNYDWFYTSKTSAGDYSRWLDKKTKYDPCPLGWKVPDGDVWETACFNVADNHVYNSVGNYFEFSSQCSQPATWYPITTNIINYSGEHITECDIHYWSSTPLYNNVGSIKSLYLYYSDDNNYSSVVSC